MKVKKKGEGREGKGRMAYCRPRMKLTAARHVPAVSCSSSSWVGTTTTSIGVSRSGMGKKIGNGNWVRCVQTQARAQAAGEPQEGVKRPRVCILGGGFGGLYTALRLRGLAWPSPEAAASNSSRGGVNMSDEYEYMLRRVSAGLRPPQGLWPNSSTNSLVSSLIKDGLESMSRGRSSENVGPRGSDDVTPEVVLVDKSDRFVFKPMLYELLLEDAAVWEVCPRYEDLLAGTGIKFIQDEVTSVESSTGVGVEATTGDASGGNGGHVGLRSGEDLQYDWLVVALGAGPSARNVPGAKENAIPFATLDHALKISTRLAKMQTSVANRSEEEEMTVVVVGGGVSGVEVASTIAQRLSNESAKIIILHGGNTVMQEAPAKQREAACKVLERRGVQIYTDFRVTSVDSLDEGMESDFCNDTMYKYGYKRSRVTGESSRKEDSEKGENVDLKSFNADLVVWTAGQSPLSGPLVDTFPKTEKGAIEIEPTLRIKGYSRIFAMGDVVVRSSSPQDTTENAAKPLPATAQVAFQQSDYAAWNIWAAINGKALLPFRYQHLGDMMLLGTSDAAMTPLGIDRLTVDGPLAAAARKAAYLYRMPTAGHAAKVGASWALKPLIQYLSSRGF